MTCLGCQRCETDQVVTLRDGRTVCNECADWRHECECRDVVNRFYPNANAIKAHFQAIEKQRGKESADRMRDDCRPIWEGRK